MDPVRRHARWLELWALLGLLLVAGADAAQAKPFIVTITYVGQISDDFDPLDLGDFYAHSTVDGQLRSSFDDHLSFTFSGYLVPTGNLLDDPWVLTHDVALSLDTVHVRFALFDHDEFTGDEQGDLNPASGKSVVDIDVDLATGTWSGDVNFPENCSSGPPSLSSQSARICFKIDFDGDGDGLLNSWERDGVDVDDNGTIDLPLPAWGASTQRKDVFVEADCLVAATHSHCPLQGAILDVVQAFANAPVLNRDGTFGVQLHVDVGALYGAGALLSVPGVTGVTGTYGDFGGGNSIAEAGNEIIESFNSPKGSNGTPFADLKQDNFDPAREPVYRYSIFGHQTNARRAANDCTSGEVIEIPGHDFMVTLGGIDPFFMDPCWGEDANGFSIGTRSQQAGTFMHEGGHALGLQHGGNESITTDFPKPNYLSVMSYAFQQCEVTPSPNGLVPGGCDFSRYMLPLVDPFHLDESSLDECVGIGDYGFLGFGPVDWDFDTILEGVSECIPGANTNVDKDINGDGLRTLLGGWDDWSNLEYTDGLSGPGGGGGVPEEADPPAIAAARQILADALAPGVAISKTGPATAKPGDVLSYLVEITNPGPGPGLAAVLTDTAPDGTTETVDLGAIVVGSQLNHASSFTMPADACPGDFTGASASVAFQDFVGNVLGASDSVALEVLDVAAPQLRVSVSPATLWSPYRQLEVITATIEVVDNCDPNPTITLVSVTSNEPESGYIGVGDDKGPDIVGAAIGTDDRSFSVRAERATFPQSTGRVYTIVYRATDTSGNSSLATATVNVPRDIGGRR